LTALIEQFEEQHYSLRAASPVERLKELMKANGLRQKDMTSIFRTPSIVSEILRGKRSLTVTHIRALSRRFSMPADLFIEDV
jgi:HTH-type transcriptional regulator/antitoxin HigA